MKIKKNAPTLEGALVFLETIKQLYPEPSDRYHTLYVDDGVLKLILWVGDSYLPVMFNEPNDLKMAVQQLGSVVKVLVKASVEKPDSV